MARFHSSLREFVDSKISSPRSSVGLTFESRWVRRFLFLLFFVPGYIYLAAMFTPDTSLASLEYTPEDIGVTQRAVESLLQSCAEIEDVPWVLETKWPDPVRSNRDCLEPEDRMEEFAYRLRYECGELMNPYLPKVGEAEGRKNPGLYQLLNTAGYWPLAMMLETITLDLTTDIGRCALAAGSEALPTLGKERRSLQNSLETLLINSEFKISNTIGLQSYLVAGLWVALHPDRTDSSYLAKESSWRYREQRRLERIHSEALLSDDLAQVRRMTAEIRSSGRLLLENLRSTHAAVSNQLFCEENNRYVSVSSKVESLKAESFRTFSNQCEAAKILTLAQALHNS